MKKVVLVVIPSMQNAYHRFKNFVSCFLPIGLISIGAILEKEGYHVEIIDGDAENLSLKETLKRTVLARPDYVGSTIMTATRENSGRN
jgi:hypothetical protein